MARNGHHSFYREQEKSILGQEKWTAKRIGKLSYKLLKWALWGFLIVATLWGCVNEFIIQTSKNLGQGVEFYSSKDFVYPNTYQAMNITGYTSSKEAVKVGSIDHDGEDVSNGQTNPFNFNIINPDFMSDDDTIKNSDKLFVNTFDYIDDGGEVPLQYYNLNLITYTLLMSGSGHATSDMIDASNNAWNSPISFPKKFKDYINDNDLKDCDYTLTNNIDFVYFLLDANDADGPNGKVSETDPNVDLIKWSSKHEEGTSYKNNEATSLNGVLSPTSALDINETNYKQLDSWKVVENLETNYDKDSTEDEVATAIWNKIKQETNLLAFNNGNGVATVEDYLSIKVDEENKIEDLYNEEIKKETEGKYDSIRDPSFADTSYSSDLTTSLLDLNAGGQIYGGAQTIVVPITKGFPVRIDEKTQSLINEWRGNKFNEWNINHSEHKDSGFDPENQMYGWTILDNSTSTKQNGYQASIMRVYDNVDSTTGQVIEDNDINESNAFYGDQRRLGWGEVAGKNADPGDNDYTYIGKDNNEYSVFDEKIKGWMNDGKYIKMESSTTINGKSISYNYASKFAGMTSLTQTTMGISQDETSSNKFYGTTPGITPKTYHGESLSQERSIISDSAIPTGQDSWGESRITFIGWSDWGKAWDAQYGPLYGAFVFPLAQLAMFIGGIFGYMASAWGTIASIVTIVFLTRGLGALLSIKGTSNQMKMQEVQTDVAKIKAKYAKYDLKEEPRMKQKQQMEIMALYRKKEINPMGSLGTIFVTMPIFISLWIIISSLPAYKVVFMGNFSWAVSSWYGVFNMGWLFILYLLIGASVGLVQGVSSKLPTWLANKRKGIKRIDDATKEAQKKQNRTQNIMIGVFVFMGLTVPALFAFYWICSGFFTIILELVKHAWKVHVSNQMKKDPAYKTPMARLFKK